MKKIFYLLMSILILNSCSSSDRGELIGVKSKKFYPDKPSGMVLIPSGSFLMGMSDDDVVGLQNAPVSTVSVKAFYMDETEITNGEYRQFVSWVRDSIVRQALAVRALEDIGEAPTQEELDKDNSINSYFPIYQPTSEISDEDKSGYELYKEQNSFGINPYDKKTFNLNFDIDKNYLVEASLELTPNAPIFEMQTTTVRLPLYKKYGIARFTLNGKKCELSVYQSLDLMTSLDYANYLFLPFTDNTSGNESYGGGRYMDVMTTDITEENTVFLNFNNTYNPYCAYNDKYSCPLTPRKNHLDLEIKAGIKAFKKH